MRVAIISCLFNCNKKLSPTNKESWYSLAGIVFDYMDGEILYY